jgi:pyruvate dehydrogenase E1 component beta subunit
MYIDDRWLYAEVGEVPDEMYAVPIGRGAIRREGRDITIVSTSYMARQASEAAEMLAGRGVESELIDLRSIKPWDQELVLGSVRKTGRLVVTDSAWRICGVAAEVAATVAGEVFRYLKAPVSRVTLPDAPAPTSQGLEHVYYPDARAIASAAEKLLLA